MNFTELMSKAAQNKQRAAKQHAEKRQGQGEAGDSQRVSSAAVKAFLLRKEKEKKHQQVEEEKACKVRIRARMEQSLNSKKGRKRSTGDSRATDNSTKELKEINKPSYSSDVVSSARGTEREMMNISVASKRPNEPSDSRTSRLHKKDASKRPEHQEDCRMLDSAGSAVRKGNREATKQPEPSVIQQPTNSANTKLKKVSTKVRARMDFRELLAMAEMNKNRPPGAVGGTADKIINAKSDGRISEIESARPKTLTGDSRNGKLDRRRVDTSTKTSKQRGPAKEKLQEGKKDEHIKPRMPDHKVTDSHSRNLPKPSSYDRYKPAREPSHTHKMSMQVRDPYVNRKRGRERDRMYDDDDDGMDDFIDDFIDDEGEDVDVSKCIQDIFGYDRSRYDHDSEGDCAFMESSFSQIQKEEARSSKIAKLEDEVEFLKEQAELKKQKQALMQQRKKK